VCVILRVFLSMHVIMCVCVRAYVCVRDIFLLILGVEMVGWLHRLNRLWQLVMDREAWRAVVHGGRKELDMTELLN